MGVLKKRIIVTVSVVVVVITVYALAVCLPYAGRLKISAATKRTANAENFYGEGSRERVMILDESTESFERRLEVTGEAGRELIFVSYSTHPGKTTDIFFGSLIAAADRGVQVKILLDAKFGGIGQDERRAFSSHDNIELYEYNRLNLLRPELINVALHDKYLIVDDRYLIFGGRNVGDKYYGRGNEKQSLDREVLVYNPDAPSCNADGAIEQVRKYFYKERDCSLAKKVKVSSYGAKRGAERRTELKKAYSDYLEEKGATQKFDYLSVTLPVNKITLITNPIEGDKKEPIVAYNLLKLAESSEKIVVQSPYVILTGRNLKVLEETADGKELCLLTNSLASTPNLPAFSNYTVNRKKYLAAGMKIWEYQETSNSIHAKTLLFDDRLTAVGSFNLDERSIRIDTESMLVIDSPALNAAMDGVLDGYFEKCLEVGLDNKYIPSESVAAGAVSGGKKALFTVAGTLLNTAKYLL